MGSLWQAPAALIALITWLTATPVSLADISRREALRRQATPQSASAFTNDDLPLWAPAAVAGSNIAQGALTEASAALDDSNSSDDSDQSGDPDDAADPNAPPPIDEEDVASSDAEDEVRDEPYWRSRMTEARAAIDLGGQSLATRQAEIRALQADFVSRDDPMQRELVRQALEKASADAKNIEAQIDAAQQEVKDIQAEARRAGVPPGWVR